MIKKDLKELKVNANEVLTDYSDKLFCVKNSDGKISAHPGRMHYDWDIVPYIVNLV